MKRSLPSPAEMYAAVARRDRKLGSLFFYAVRSTGIFCRPGCPARTPKPENLEFFASQAQALAAGYRACRRCQPMERPGLPPAWIRPLLERLDQSPGERLPDASLRALGFDPVRVRRWFQRERGMSFQAWQRQRQLGQARQALQDGAEALHAGLDAGYQSSSGFIAAYKKLFGEAPSQTSGSGLLSKRIDSPLGPLWLAADDRQLHLCEFEEPARLRLQLSSLQRLGGHQLVPGDNDILRRASTQLEEYFAGHRRDFALPLALSGTAFQRAAWQALLAIPFGETRSYGAQAAAMGKPSAVRAVGRANGANRLAILVPCHRVLAADGKLCGYGGELWRKQFLLELEAGLPRTEA